MEHGLILCDMVLCSSNSVLRYLHAGEESGLRVMPAEPKLSTLSVSVPLISLQYFVTTRDFNHEITIVDQRVIARCHSHKSTRHRYGLNHIRTCYHSRTPAV